MDVIHPIDDNYSMGYREKIPKKITPDRIKESLVHVGMNTSLNFPVSLGYFHSVFLDAGYSHQENSSPKESHQLYKHFFFHEEKGTSAVITPLGVTFNCIDNYIGWTSYSDEINKLIKELYEVNLINEIHHLGIRYASEFPGNKLFNYVDFTISSSVFPNPNQTGKIRFETIEGDYKIIVNLLITKNLKPFTQHAKSSTELSIIDVDVIRSGMNIRSMEDFKRILNESHHKEKQIFFSLLTDKFLNTLNPEY